VKDGKDWVGGRRVKESEWKMRRRGGVDEVKNRSGQWEGPGGGGELDGCIMHRVPTSKAYSTKANFCRCKTKFGFS
jgi:hypothetical protein